MSNNKCHNKVRKQNLASSFKVAFSGIGIGAQCERNFQVQLVVSVFALALLAILGGSIIEWSLVIICISVVLSLELFNTALERLIDFLEPDIHQTIRLVKDMVAGGVLLSAIGGVVVGLLIYIPKILGLI